jgi:hypothetical protein
MRIWSGVWTSVIERRLTLGDLPGKPNLSRGLRFRRNSNEHSMMRVLRAREGCACRNEGDIAQR